MTSNGNLTTTIDNRIARIEFSHPAGNSMPSELLLQLTEAIKSASGNNEVSIIVLQSGGSSAFCGGASFTELLAVSNHEEGSRFFSGFANVINAIRKSKKPVIGRIHGKAVGGGVGIAAACDYAFATTSASVKLSELTIGIGPFVIAPAVERKIGIRGLSELTLKAHEWKTASWAHQVGLYAEVFETVEALDVALEDFISRLASYNPQALIEMKTAFWEGTEHWDTLLYERAAVSGLLVLSDFTKSALAEFRK